MTSQCSDGQNDLTSLRKELLQAEQTRLELESEKMNLNEKVKFLEIEKEKVEIELGQVARERGDLSNQLAVLARKKESLNEEIMRLGQKLEQSSEMNARLNRNLEDLVKDNEEKQVSGLFENKRRESTKNNCLFFIFLLQVILETIERDFQRIQESFASLRSEKEALEGVLFDTQTNYQATHLRKSQLEKEQQDLLIKQEGYKGEILRLKKELENSERRCHDVKHTLTKQCGDQEAEYQQLLVNLKKQNEENIKKLIEERDQMRVSLEKRLQQSLSQLGGEKEEEINQLQLRIEELQVHIDNICQQHEEVLLRAENDKQQALLIGTYTYIFKNYFKFLIL